jgi:solute carrier family 40 (iron-regulated transporter), member 1
MSLIDTGMWSITYQLVCIIASVLSFLAVSYNISMTLLLSGVCASRIGLWVFDVAVTQLMQEFIPEGIRGSVGGTQNSLNAFFQLSAFSLGIFIPSPEQFYINSMSGCISVGIAALLYAIFVFRRKAMFVALA